MKKIMFGAVILAGVAAIAFVVALILPRSIAVPNETPNIPQNVTTYAHHVVLYPNADVVPSDQCVTMDCPPDLTMPERARQTALLTTPLIGMTVAQAESFCEKHDLVLREMDIVGLAYTMEYRFNRVDVYVMNHKIYRYDIG